MLEYKPQIQSANFLLNQLDRPGTVLTLKIHEYRNRLIRRALT